MISDWSDNPLLNVTAAQIYGALQALGAAPLFDPDRRPDGPIEDDRPKLLGLLLVAVETTLSAEPSHTTAEINEWYGRQVGIDRDGGAQMAGMIARRFTLLYLLLESPQDSGQLVQATANSVAATVALLRIWKVGMVNSLTHDPDGSLLQQTFREACEHFDSAQRSFERVRRLLLDEGADV